MAIQPAKNRINAVNAYLLALKFNPKAKGFKILRRAILLALDKPKGITLKRDIYPALEKACGMSAAALERDMANAIDAAFLNADIGEVERVFGGTISPKSGRPTVKELIAGAAAHIIVNSEQ